MLHIKYKTAILIVLGAFLVFMPGRCHAGSWRTDYLFKRGIAGGDTIAGATAYITPWVEIANASFVQWWVGSDGAASITPGAYSDSDSVAYIQVANDTSVAASIKGTNLSAFSTILSGQQTFCDTTNACILLSAVHTTSKLSSTLSTMILPPSLSAGSGFNAYSSPIINSRYTRMQILTRGRVRVGGTAGAVTTPLKVKCRVTWVDNNYRGFQPW